MRIDKFLKVSRVIKRRSVANEACDAGRVSINGRVVKASAAVKPGDVVEVGFAGGNVKFEIFSVKETVKKDEAASMYRIIEEYGNE
ncbi:MAG: RNA-binding S4 domain-containing protein [Clostridia bacterium]|nr:RNA-binding S4 domain-containing protein [Clostridia bacterium]